MLVKKIKTMVLITVVWSDVYLQTEDTLSGFYNEYYDHLLTSRLYDVTPSDTETHTISTNGSISFRVHLPPSRPS